jgi:hypothetical protein
MGVTSVAMLCLASVFSFLQQFLGEKNTVTINTFPLLKASGSRGRG